MAIAKMTVGRFCERIRTSRDERLRSRILAIREYSDYEAVKRAYGEDVVVGCIHDFVDANAFVPMPQRVFAELDDWCAMMRGRGRCPVVVGLDAYLSLLDEMRLREAFELLGACLMDASGGRAAVFVLWRNWERQMRDAFKHPSIWSTESVVAIGDGGGVDGVAEIAKVGVSFVWEKFASRLHPCHKSLKEYLHECERKWGRLDDASDGDCVRVAVRFGGERAFPGISPEVRQCFSLRDFLRDHCGLSLEVSDGALRWIAEHTSGCDVLAELRERFFAGGGHDETVFALKRFQAIHGDGEREVFLRILRMSAASGSFLAEVLKRVSDRTERFFECYVNVPGDMLSAHEADRWAAEREMCIRTLGIGAMEVGAAVRTFISQTKALSSQTMKPWLSLGLEDEEIEWIRRACECADEYDRRVALEQSHLLSAYRGTPDENLHPALNAYFSAYRDLKCRNSVTEEFCGRALAERIPDEVGMRAAMLSEWRNDSETALLVVDALGGEYVPFLVERARAHRFVAKFAGYARADLPTSTPFNDVLKEWGDAERHEKFDDFDKILHSRIESPSKAFAAELRLLDGAVMAKIDALLKTHRRVVLTADHGATRLAVLAYRQGLAKNVRVDGDALSVEDWRYARRNGSGYVDSDDLVESLSGDYAVVRGYARFMHPGGPGFEMHGGATIEEQIVPFLVLERFTGADADDGVATGVSEGAAPEQICENDDFDI